MVAGNVGPVLASIITVILSVAIRFAALEKRNGDKVTRTRDLSLSFIW